MSEPKKKCPCCDGPYRLKDWPENTGPLPVLRRKYPERFYRPQWMDHSYRTRVRGKWRYVAEPYWLDSSAMRDLLYLRENGFTVEVSGMSKHYPGACVAVWITKEP